MLICNSSAAVKGRVVRMIKSKSFYNLVANGGITPFWTWQGPWESHVPIRARKGHNPPFGLAPQVPLLKSRGFLALVIVLGITLESGASVLLVVPNCNPVAYSCGLDSRPDIGDVPVQALYVGLYSP